MKRSIVLIAITLVMAPIFPQQIFVEPEYGYYDPSGWTRIDTITINTDVRSQEFDFKSSPRYGANLGISFPGDYQMYIGYKLWSADQPKTNFNTFTVGIKGVSYLKDRDLGLRLGMEYLKNSMGIEIDSPTSFLWSLSGEGTGFSFEAGMVYRLYQRVIIFVGIDYFQSDITFNKLVENDVNYTRAEFGLSEGDATIKMNGINIKMSILFILTNPLEFED